MRGWLNQGQRHTVPFLDKNQLGAKDHPSWSKCIKSEMSTAKLTGREAFLLSTEVPDTDVAGGGDAGDPESCRAQGTCRGGIRHGPTSPTIPGGPVEWGGGGTTAGAGASSIPRNPRPLSSVQSLAPGDISWMLSFPRAVGEGRTGMPGLSSPSWVLQGVLLHPHVSLVTIGNSFPGVC